jgi:hypothetical protein
MQFLLLLVPPEKQP